MPGVRALHHPAARLAVHPTEERWFAFLPKVGDDPPISHRGLTIPERVPFVETAVVRPPHATAGRHDDRIERRREGPFVVEVRVAQNYAYRDAAPIGKDVALRAPLRPICWVRSREIPLWAPSRSPSRARPTAIESHGDDHSSGACRRRAAGRRTAAPTPGTGGDTSGPRRTRAEWRATLSPCAAARQCRSSPPDRRRGDVHPWTSVARAGGTVATSSTAAPGSY
jgi:hypothetical protein